MHWNDSLDEVYWEIADLIGFENEDGEVALTGKANDLSEAIEDQQEADYQFTSDDTSLVIPVLCASVVSTEGDIINYETSVSHVAATLAHLTRRYNP